MPQIACLFCHHRNPAGSRYCNDCGSPMYLRGCPICNTVDKREATHCYQCGAALPEPPAEEPDESPMRPRAPFSVPTPTMGEPGGEPSHAQTRSPRHSHVVLACGVLAFGLIATGLDHLGRRGMRSESFEQIAPAANVIANDEPAPLRAEPPEDVPIAAASDAPAVVQAPAPRIDAVPRGARSAKGSTPTTKGPRGTRRAPDANKRR